MNSVMLRKGDLVFMTFPTEELLYIGQLLSDRCSAIQKIIPVTGVSDAMEREADLLGSVMKRLKDGAELAARQKAESTAS